MSKTRVTKDVPEGTPEEIIEETVIEETASTDEITSQEEDSTVLDVPLLEEVVTETTDDLLDIKVEEPLILEEDKKERDSTESSTSSEPEKGPIEEEPVVEEDIEKAPETIEEKLEAYLSSYKAEDRIVQESKGGNFISANTYEVYVPLKIFRS